mgnify:CR=1 FL=1|uniref:Uncharacterized protein n=1 Tax=viral metagenome TaxID=1070528 RepID=A0A6C0LY36_9ZZZZ
MKIGVLGNGFVGKATRILGCKDIELMVYDIMPELYLPLGTTLKDLCVCDLIFVSVPTPMSKNGSCYLGILESVIQDLSNITNLNDNLVVIRSTVPPGTSDRFNCYFMPEFLTEKNFEYDFRNCQNWIFGLKNTPQDQIFKKKIKELIDYAFFEHKINYNNIHFVANKEAEMIKMFRNNYLSVKVSFCNEISQFCELKGIDYENVRKLAAVDDRIGLSHTKVPGPDGKKGFGGTCFPKDTNSLRYEMNNSGMKSYIVDAAINRNVEVDRVEQDWFDNKGRAVVE